MKPLTPQQVEILQKLCLLCPHGAHRPECPFARLSSLPHYAREDIFRSMTTDGVAALFLHAAEACGAQPVKECEERFAAAGA